MDINAAMAVRIDCEGLEEFGSSLSWVGAYRAKAAKAFNDHKAFGILRTVLQ